MEVKYNVTGAERKNLVAAISDILGIPAKYKGMPSMAYEIDTYVVTKDGVLIIDDLSDSEEVENLLEGIARRGFTFETPEEEPSISVPRTRFADGEGEELTISVPRAGFTDEAVDNLFRILESKGRLFSHAFGKPDLKIKVGNERIEFPWFSELEAEKASTYTRFIEAICNMAKTQKRITAKPRENENEKYAFRCFLLRLGFIGDEYKADRKVLLKNLEGSSAFKSVEQKGETA